MNGESVTVVLEDSQGGQRDVLLQLAEDEQSGEYEVSLQLGGAEGMSLRGRGEDLFDALCELRLKLEQHGLLLRCAGTDLDVYPSGMSRAMGGGRKAYRLTMGKPATRVDMVDIFDASTAQRGSTVSEQKAFFEQWLQSLGK